MVTKTIMHRGLAAVAAVSMASCGSTGEQEDIVGILGQEVVGDCAVTMTISPSSPQSAGAEVHVQGDATCLEGATPEYQFYRRGVDDRWTIVQSYSTSNTFVWNTTGAATGSYTYQVWARRSGESLPYEGSSKVQSIDISDSFAFCKGADLTVATTAPVGTPVVLTGSSTCTGSGTPEFRYWGRNPVSLKWTVLQDWTTGSANWAPSEQGDWLLQAWTRATGSSASYQTASPTKVLTATDASGCAYATLYTPTPTSPRPVGTTVTLTGAASCSSQEEYRYYVRRPTGVWFAVGPYSTSPSQSWNTTGESAGTYNIQLYVRRVGQTVPYEVASTLKVYVLQ